MAFRLPPDPDDTGDTDPEGAIPTRMEIPVTAQLDALVAAKYRGVMEADRRCEERLADARGYGHVVSVAVGAIVAVSALGLGITLAWLFR